MPNFPGLDPLAGDGTAVAGAQRFLASAYDSVANLFDNVYPLVRGQRDAKRGRLTHVEQDVFRSAIVFAGAGVDSTLKELIRLAVPSQVTRSDRARDKFRNFSADHLGGRNGVDPKALAELIIEPDPQAALLEAYVKQLTGSSLQSVEQVRETLSALGLHDHEHLYKDSKKLRDLFIARNQIAHELDLKKLGKEGDRTRHERKINESKILCHDGLNFTQRVINSVIRELESV